ncbi:MAG TPA: adenylate/guanylate cyclase domain-containing protein [Acidimicrobiales bacterium]|nr:adenylate/guanylate cyclase domain-containing protein [Acidimicrobiales bacterium]
MPPQPPARTRYTTAGRVEIAYQVLGDGPIDILLYTGAVVPVECMDDDPSMHRFHRRLASFGRLIRFDLRGRGLSDRGSVDDPPTFADWAEDGAAVLDAAGSERAAVLAPYVDSPAGILLAATRPERVSSLVVINGAARARWAPDYPIGMPDEMVDVLQEQVPDPDARERGFDVLAVVAPSVADDPAFRAWWDRAGSLGLTPAMARAQSTLYDFDLRHVLPDIEAPTLVLQRAGLGHPIFSPGFGPYLAEHIEGARYVELPGADAPYWVGDAASVLDEIEEFLTGVRGGAGVERVLTTVLFTDIVGSTDRAASIGDDRWRDLLDRHDATVRAQIDRFGGREVKTVGDGFVAIFGSPGRAIQCAVAIREAVAAFDIGVRAGLHAGEVEIRGDDVAGLAVHIGARVAGLADAGEVLVSSTVKDLVAGSDLSFGDRGEHRLKGVPGTWRLFLVES